MVSKAMGATLIGLDAHIITVEADVANGLPQFGIVGLPDSSVRESRERVASALKSSGVNYQGKKITVNLAPGDLKKAGSLFDLPIAVSILRSIGKIPPVNDCLFAGELSLDGGINPVRGILSIVYEARRRKIKNCIVPFANRIEASVVKGVNIYAAKNLREVIGHLNGESKIEPVKAMSDDAPNNPCNSSAPDFVGVKGQELAKRAFAVAAAGQHNILVIGPPGTGKTMMASSLPSIMPPLSFDESVEVTKIYSVRGLTRDDNALITVRPFRITHHTISRVALIGGGSPLVPGEISLAHTGVLFLDEIAEYPRNVLESLRQPLEDRQIVVSRIANNSVIFPAKFMLVAASNPCPCGNLGIPEKCRCTEGEISKYLGKISEPLLDRIDIQIELSPVSYDELSGKGQSTSSAELRKKVAAALEMQKMRFKNDGVSFNSHMTSSHIEKYCELGEAERSMMGAVYKSLSLSARAHQRILKLARTIADMDGSEKIEKMHLAEAIGYRNMDRKLWKR